MADHDVIELNHRFIDAFRQGSWAALEPLLADDFQYLDGATGESWPMQRYIDDIDGHPQPDISIDQVALHVAGDVAVVSARTAQGDDRFHRYVDTYAKRGTNWLCVHACVWPLSSPGG